MERQAPWLAAAAGLLAGLLTMTAHPIGIFYDDAIYLLTAKALAEGQGYVYPHLPGTPNAIHYPPGWPLVLALAWKVLPRFPENAAWLKMINPMMLAAIGAGMVVAGRRLLMLPTGVALAVAIVAVAGIPVLTLTNVLLSEPMFLALLFPTLLACERLARDGPPVDEMWALRVRGDLRLALLAAGLTAAIVLTRTIAGVVFIATVMVLLRDGRWRTTLVYGVVTVLLLLPWQLFVWRSGPGFPDELRGSYGPYLEWVVDGYNDDGWPFLRDVVVQNSRDAWRMLGAFFAPFTGGVVRAALTALAVASLGVGMFISWQALAARVTALALFGYLVAVMGWPYQTERFVWAVWPLLLLVTATGLFSLWRAAEGRALRYTAATAGILVTAGHLTYTTRAHVRGWSDSASEQMTRSTTPIVQYALGESRFAGQVIAADASPMVALYTGLQVVPVDILTPQEHLREKSAQQFADDLSAIDRRYAPATYIFLPIEGRMRALSLVSLESGRALRERSFPGPALRTFDVVVTAP